jgi:putative restriction endonuclease
MADDIILLQFDQLATWSRGDQRAPHKPLLALYALGRWARGDRGDISFKDVDRDLTEPLKEFGPPRKAYHPGYPFWWLRSDDVWVENAPGLDVPPAGSGPSKGELLAHDARAGFSQGVRAVLDADPGLVAQITGRLFDQHFPDTIHADILASVGLSLRPDVSGEHKRDPEFRQKVLVAYEWRCAVCGFDVRLGSVSIALDAAHIRWRQSCGPAHENNGLALCVLHHKTFDLGAFTLNYEGMLLVSDQANGTAGFEEALLRYHGKPVRSPRIPGGGQGQCEQCVQFCALDGPRPTAQWRKSALRSISMPLRSASAVRVLTGFAGGSR